MWSSKNIFIHQFAAGAQVEKAAGRRFTSDYIALRSRAQGDHQWWLWRCCWHHYKVKGLIYKLFSVQTYPPVGWFGLSQVAFIAYLLSRRGSAVVHWSVKTWAVAFRPNCCLTILCGWLTLWTCHGQLLVSHIWSSLLPWVTNILLEWVVIW